MKSVVYTLLALAATVSAQVSSRSVAAPAPAPASSSPVVVVPAASSTTPSVMPMSSVTPSTTTSIVIVTPSNPPNGNTGSVAGTTTITPLSYISWSGSSSWSGSWSGSWSAPSHTTTPWTPNSGAGSLHVAGALAGLGLTTLFVLQL